MANVILLGGTSHGGWYFDTIAAQLREIGHTVFAPNPTGLDPSVESAVAANLDTHIQDVLDVIDGNSLNDVVLVGHSYGGMIITGVADRTKAEVKGLIYLDAALPNPGQRLWDIIDDGMRKGFIDAARDGLNIEPDPGFKAIRPKVMPHPLATKLQPLSYSLDIFKVPCKVYVYAEEYFGIPEMKSPFEAIYNRLKSDPGWKTYSLPFGHDLLVLAPVEVFSIIREALEELN